ncbi:EAL domain-containing protein [Fredinandcohnia humi]
MILHLFANSNIIYIIFSIFIALSSAIVCFKMVLNIIPKAPKKWKKYWLILASFTLGLGTWTGQFIGITAFQYDTSLSFHLPILITSIAVVMLTSIIAIIVLVFHRGAFLLAGLLFSIGISTMHYLYMYSHHALTISITDRHLIIAVLIGTILNCIGCYIYKIESIKEYGQRSGSNVGIFVGLSSVALYYISMSVPTYQHFHFENEVNLENILIFVVLGVFLLIIVGIITTYYQQKLFKHIDKLKNQELYYKSLYDLNPDAIIMTDLNGIIIKLNEATESLSGYKSKDVLGKTFHHFIYEPDLHYIVGQFQKAITGEIVESELKLRKSTGEIIDIYCKSIPIKVDDLVVGVYGVIRDITTNKRNLAALQNAESRYRSIVEESFVGVFIVQNERIIFVNSMMSTLFGYSIEDFLQLSFWDIVAEEDHDYLRVRITNRIKDNRSFEHYELRGKRRNGEFFYMKAHSSEMSYNNEPAIMCSVIDITDQVESMKKVEFMAYHDPLTNLPNHRRLHEDLTEKIRKKEPFSLIFIDLNEFKKTNDRYGHLAGDAVLQEVAKRLYKTDYDIVSYHIGGDEFAIVTTSVDNFYLKEMTSSVATSIRKPIPYENYSLQVYASFGVATYPQDAGSITELLRRADLAMYASKEKGKSKLVFYQSKLLAEVEERFQLEQDLKEALEKKQFVLYYQPQFNLQTKAFSGAEALIRWNHPQKGILPPGVFIDVLEETGLIIDVGEWVICEVIKTVRAWESKGYYLPRISINVSSRQFEKQNLYKLIKQANQGEHTCIRKIDLEITESAMINLEKSVETLTSLKKLGVNISLDDFGTGYSSLSVLHQLPIDCVKIDRSFIQDLNQDSQNVIQMILNLAKKLDVKVVAEGIETKEQLDFLLKEGCDYAQGFYFSKPLSKQEFEEKWLIKTSG